MTYFGTCKECGEEVEAIIHWDAPTYCPCCRSIDSIEEQE